MKYDDLDPADIGTHLHLVGGIWASDDLVLLCTAPDSPLPHEFTLDGLEPTDEQWRTLLTLTGAVQTAPTMMRLLALLSKEHTTDA